MVRATTANGRTRTARAAQMVCYILLGLVLVYVLIARYLQPVVFEESIGVEPARVQQVEHRIDPNTASWAELGRLPGIGEVLAKRIVAYRRARFAASSPDRASPVAFSCLEDLGAVSGIGPETLARVREYVKFPTPASRPGG